jgi:hypothetical protein
VHDYNEQTPGVKNPERSQTADHGSRGTKADKMKSKTIMDIDKGGSTGSID